MTCPSNINCGPVQKITTNLLGSNERVSLQNFNALSIWDVQLVFVHTKNDENVARVKKLKTLLIPQVHPIKEVWLSEELPNSGYFSKFPTAGAMLGFYVGGHFMIHIGQMSAWRRAVGLGPA